MSPFKVVFGREPPSIIPYEVNSTYPPTIQASLTTINKLLQKLKSNLKMAQNYMKLQADKKRREFQLQIGDLALVKLQPYRQHLVALRKNKKLGMRFFGPFEVVEKIGSVAYKLRLPDTTRIHPIFHISFSKGLWEPSLNNMYLYP